MRIFMTGATGFVGTAVATALRRRGDDVAALVRAGSDSKHLRDLGATVVAGDLGSLPNLAGYDRFVHCAQSRSSDSIELDRGAVRAFAAMNHSDGGFVYTSGVWVLGNTGESVADETSPVSPLAIVAWRPAHERLVLDAGNPRFATCVIRPGCVYGGRQSLLADWFTAANEGRAISIAGDGTNRWAMVDLHDLTECYLRAIDQRATGILHAVDDSNHTINECARAVIASRGSSSGVEHVPLEAARAKMGVFADALTVNQRISSAATRQNLGWSPTRSFVA
ncbi:MAG TPA: NAD-dependent epimerase/dehydratase family protein, partial [Thermoanaerobaculia bacterium]|nr:NAD-dependent epimerase/dehydratase family protein [Thermoanaerobaculia bacterium]